MSRPGDPMAMMASAYAAAFEQGARAWLRQGEIWRETLRRSMAWPAVTAARGAAFGPTLLAAEPWLDTLSVQLVEAEDRVGMSVTCLDMRIDMMITQLPGSGTEAFDVIDVEAEAEDAATPVGAMLKRIGVR